MEKIYAGIVTFNPDIERLKENVCAICIQVPEVVIFDNGSSNFVDIQECISVFHNVILFRSDENIGIAAALNRLMQWGFDNKYDWMLDSGGNICSIPSVSGEDRILQAMIAAFFLLTPLIILILRKLFMREMFEFWVYVFSLGICLVCGWWLFWGRFIFCY